MISNSQCFGMLRASPPLPNATTLCFSSLYWLSGFSSLVISLVNVLRRVVTKRKFSPLLMVHLIEKYSVNMVLTPPSQVAMLVQSPVLKLADLSSVRAYLVGGGALPETLRASLQDHLLYGAIVFTYAMTEVGEVISSTLPFQKASNSSGKITANKKLKVKDSLSGK